MIMERWACQGLKWSRKIQLARVLNPSIASDSSKIKTVRELRLMEEASWICFKRKILKMVVVQGMTILLMMVIRLS